MSNKKELVVKLKAFKGKKTFDEKGKLNSQNQTVSLYHKRLEWSHFLESARSTYTSLEVISVEEERVVTTVEEDFQGKKYNDRKTSYKVIPVSEEIKEELKKAMGNGTAELTADQKKIAELEAKMAEILNDKKEAAADKLPDNTPYINEEKEAARNKYTEVFGEKPHHAKSLETLNKDIEEELKK